MLVDLSIDIREGMDRLPILPEVKVDVLRALKDGAPLEIRHISLATHVGTHMDAPSHAIAGSTTIDQIALDRVCGPAVVIPVRPEPGQAISLADVQAAGLEIQAGDIVLLDTGFAKKIGTKDYHFNPYLAQDLCDHLVAKRVKLVGVDCVTVDMPLPVRPPDFAYPAHRTLLGNGVLIIENLGDMSAVSGKRVHVYAFPLKITGSDAGHVRVVAQL
ncbi:MAG TPA: cyclase family protein [Candidatus Binatia bacterium]|nr:cyclase family protein [Candidatus Binatia bacterium]